MRRWGAILFAVPALALVLAACGEKTVDTDAAEQTVTNVVEEESGFRATDMECPEDVEAKEGATFECEFTGPEGPYVASVRITDVDGDDATFAVESKPTGE